MSANESTSQKVGITIAEIFNLARSFHMRQVKLVAALFLGVDVLQGLFARHIPDLKIA